MQRRRLVLRVYAFAVGLSLAVTAALVILPGYTRGPRYLEPTAALLQYLVERWSLKDGAKLDIIMGRIEPRLRGRLSLYDLHGNLLRTNASPALDAPTAEERAQLRTAKWALSTGRIVVRSDDGTMLAVYRPNRRAAVASSSSGFASRRENHTEPAPTRTKISALIGST